MIQGGEIETIDVDGEDRSHARTATSCCRPIQGVARQSQSATLYGTTTGGGIWGNGTVFAVNTDGTGFATLHTFTALDPNNLPIATERYRMLLFLDKTNAADGIAPSLLV